MKGDEWEEKWGEWWASMGRANKWADKWAKDGPNVWHEKWGEEYDGEGGCVKFTDKVTFSVLDKMCHVPNQEEEESKTILHAAARQTWLHMQECTPWSPSELT